MFCHNCGKKIDDNSVFCVYCGTKILRPGTQTAIYSSYSNATNLVKPENALNNKDVEDTESIYNGENNDAKIGEKSGTNDRDYLLGGTRENYGAGNKQYINKDRDAKVNIQSANSDKTKNKHRSRRAIIITCGAVLLATAIAVLVLILTGTFNRKGSGSSENTYDVLKGLNAADDTDGDGVINGIEAYLGSDPRKAEDRFTTVYSTGEVSEYNPVSIEVEAVTDAEGAATLEVTELSAADSFMFSAAGTGYIGGSYELTTEGELDHAVLTFRYDASEHPIEDSFQPRIYWYDEENDELIELENQSVSEGQVSAEVSHFSVYTLRNKTEIDYIRDILTNIFTPDSAVDSNGDGISDYYTELINNGTLRYQDSTLLAGVLDIFGADNDDWDGDGLKNGEEIEVGFSIFGGLKLIAHSNPYLVDSDNDGISDYIELKELHTSAFRYDRTSVSSLNSLEADGKYQYAIYKEDIRDKVAQGLTDKYATAKNCLINYIADYYPDETIKKNAEAEYEQQLWRKAANIMGVVSKLIGVTKDIYSVMEKGAALASLDDTFDETVTYQQELIDINNAQVTAERRVEVIDKGISTLKLPEKLGDVTEDLQSDDTYRQIDAAASVISSAEIAISVYELYSKCEIYPLAKEAKDMTKLSATLGKKSISFTGKLTLIKDGFETVQSIMEVQELYAKMKANAGCYSNYMDMLIYIRDHAEDDYMRRAAGDIATDIFDNFGMQYQLDLAKACAKEAAIGTANMLLDGLAEVSTIAKIIDIAVDLYQYTGVVELGEYGVYFTTMAEVSKGCKSVIDSLVNNYDQTFSYYQDNEGKTERYMVQLAQSRIMGEYYWYEYLQQNTGAGWLSKLIDFVNGNETPDYDRMFSDKTKSIYSDAARLQLKLSHNLPKYNELWEDKKADELKGIADISNLPRSLNDFLAAFYSYRDTEYGQEYDCSDLSGVSSNILDQLMFNVTCCDYSVYPVAQREERINNDIRDPEGWADNKNYSMCYVYSLDSVKWVAQNIFHVTDEAFEEMMDAGRAERHFYESDGTIYYFTSGIGWDGADASIINARQDGDTYYIFYDLYNPDGMYGYASSVMDYYRGMFYAELTFEEIDGEYYWTLLKHSSTIPEDMQLPDWQQAYFKFIISGEYGSTGTYYPDSSNDSAPISFGLYDKDGDGVPELYGSSGADNAASRQIYIYTFYEGGVSFVGSTGPDSSEVPEYMAAAKDIMADIRYWNDMMMSVS